MCVCVLDKDVKHVSSLKLHKEYLGSIPLKISLLSILCSTIFSYFGWFCRYVRLLEHSKHTKLQWVWNNMQNMYKEMASLSHRATPCAIIIILVISGCQREKLWSRNMLMPAKGSKQVGLRDTFVGAQCGAAKICPQWSGLVHRTCRSLLPGITCPLSKHLSKGCILKCLESVRWEEMLGSFWVT